MIDISLLPYSWVIGLVVLFGLILGSFFNVVIVRLPRMMEREWQREATPGNPLPAQAPFNLAVPRSHCPICKNPIRAWENIPLLSYALLRGRCRHCSSPISWHYPAVELFSALIPVACIVAFGVTSTAFAYSIMLWFLLILSTIDSQHMILPDQLTYPLLWLGLLSSISILPLAPDDAILGALIGYLFLWSVYWLFKLTTGKEGLGYGDFKLLACIGAWLGWQSLPWVVLLSSLVGALFGSALIVLKRHSRSEPMPFGPFLALGAVLTLFFGDTISTWYWSELGNS